MEVRFFEEQIQQWSYPTILRNRQFELKSRQQPIWNPSLDDENKGLGAITDGELSENKDKVLQVNVNQLRGKARKQEEICTVQTKS